MSHQDGTGKLRIRTPGSHDVLCGRGGGINAHVGNVAFRELVNRDKERYNLEGNKNKKAEMSQRIVDHVKELGGRFLQRDEESGHYGGQSWWVEIDDIKALAKTSQALREGAPSIRATAKKAVRGRPASSSRKGTRSSTGRGKKRKVYSRNAVETEGEDDEWLPKKAAHQVEEPQEEKVHPIIRGIAGGHRGKVLISPKNFESDTTSEPETSNFISPEMTSKTPTVELDHAVPDFPQSFFPHKPLSAPILHPYRMHSLCQSEMSNDGFLGDEKFIDPFEFDNSYRLESEIPSGMDESSSSNLSAINNVIRFKSASSDYLNTSSSSENNKDASGTESDIRKNNKIKSMRSFISQLSEIQNNKNHLDLEEADLSFFDGINSVHDVSTPGLTSPRGGDIIPTHLIPASDIEKSSLKRFAIH